MLSFAVNYVAVIVAAIVAMVIGFVWYSPLFFGKVWTEQTGMKMGKGKGMGKSMLIALISSLITAFVLDVIIQTAGVTTVTQGLIVAGVVWLGFVVSYQMVRMAFEKTSMNFFLEEVAHHLLVFCIMSIIFVLMA